MTSWESEKRTVRHKIFNKNDFQADGIKIYEIGTGSWSGLLPARKKLLHIAFASIAFAASLLFFGTIGRPAQKPAMNFKGPPLFLRMEFDAPFACDYLIQMNADGLGCFVTLYNLPAEPQADWLPEVKAVSFFQIANACSLQLIFDELDSLAQQPDTSQRHCWDAPRASLRRNGELLENNGCSGDPHFRKIFHTLKDVVGMKWEDCSSRP